MKKGQLLGYVGNTGCGPESTSGAFVPLLHVGMYKTTGMACGESLQHIGVLAV